MKRHIPFSFLVCLVVLNADFVIPISRANAASITKQQYCIPKLSLPVYGSLLSRDRDPHINIREQPSTSSNIRYVGSSGTEVIIRAQVVGDDDYCWFRIKFKSSNVTGWIRGDLLDIYLDYGTN